MKLFVDDVRSAPDLSWTVVTTITGAINMLATGRVEELSLDHDICHPTHPEDPEVGSYCECPENYTAVALYVAVMPKEDLPKRIWIHSANPGGRKILAGILMDAGIESEENPIAHPHGYYQKKSKDKE